MKEVCKTYKPEILTCPICSSKLAYCFTMSNKLVYFSSGKRMRIKNLGYFCPKCGKGKTYVSQTAKKLSFKGYSYSAKILCQVAVLKEKHMSRDHICDYFFSKGIEISDRNVDNLYKKFLSLSAIDESSLIPTAYSKMIEEYSQIRLAIDVITIEKNVFIIVYDYFSTDILAFKRFNSLDDINLKKFLSSYINPNMNITVIATIRKDQVFIPYLKSICPENTKIIAFNKY